MILSTTEKIEGRKIIKYLDVVLAETFFTFSMDGILSGPIFSGGKSSKLQDEIEAAKEEALYLIQKCAEEKGANAVLGFRINFSSSGERSMVVSAYGTAVILE